MMLRTNSLGQSEIVDGPQVLMGDASRARDMLLAYRREWPILRYRLNTEVTAPPSDINHITKSGDIFFGAVKKLLVRYPDLSGFYPKTDPATLERMIHVMASVATDPATAIHQFLALRAARASAMWFNDRVDSKNL